MRPRMPMLESLDCLRDTHLIGRRCHEHVLDCEHYPILKNTPFLWVGHSVLRAPYRMIRLRSFHSHLVATLSGKGRTLIGGEVVDFRPGQVLLGPVGRHHAFEISGAGPWSVAWVFFNDDETAPVLMGKHAELIEADTTEFVSTLHLLVGEAAGAAEPAVMSALVTLLHTYARRIVGADQIDPRLWRLWEKVEADLAQGWTVARLARIACMSEEHLRRLCHRHYQHSPIEHLAHLRMRRAGTMLRSSPEKLDEIARRVGYASMYSFSSAFRRWCGLPPTQFRQGATPLPSSPPP